MLCFLQCGQQRFRESEFVDEVEDRVAFADQLSRRDAVNVLTALQPDLRRRRRTVRRFQHRFEFRERIELLLRPFLQRIPVAVDEFPPFRQLLPFEEFGQRDLLRFGTVAAADQQRVDFRFAGRARQSGFRIAARLFLRQRKERFVECGRGDRADRNFKPVRDGVAVEKSGSPSPICGSSGAPRRRPGGSRGRAAMEYPVAASPMKTRLTSAGIG